MEEHTAYVMFALERVKVCGPKMAILGKEGPRNFRAHEVDEMRAMHDPCDYCGGAYGCSPHCHVETIEQGVKR